MKLNKNINSFKQAEALPEKVLQFGTGVLLRGLPDYYIDKANKQGIFNGRIVVVKSTGNGGADEFYNQDCLYTHLHATTMRDVYDRRRHLRTR
jgi:tagaturonate reductase